MSFWTLERVLEIAENSVSKDTILYQNTVVFGGSTQKFMKLGGIHRRFRVELRDGDYRIYVYKSTWLGLVITFGAIYFIPWGAAYLGGGGRYYYMAVVGSVLYTLQLLFMLGRRVFAPSDAEILRAFERKLGEPVTLTKGQFYFMPCAMLLLVIGLPIAVTLLQGDVAGNIVFLQLSAVFVLAAIVVVGLPGGVIYYFVHAILRRREVERETADEVRKRCRK